MLKDSAAFQKLNFKGGSECLIPTGYGLSRMLFGIGLRFRRQLLRLKERLTGGGRERLFSTRGSRGALRRIAARVRQGRHDVPAADVVRRFERSWKNVEERYRGLADEWALYDNSGNALCLMEHQP